MKRNELVKEYDDYFTNNPQKWAVTRRNEYAAEIITKYKPAPRKVIDIGCGNGHTVAYLQRVFVEAEFFGLDLSPVACQLAKQNTNNAMIFNCFIEDFNPGFKFDVITCLGTAEHFTDPKAGLRLIKDHLEPGGILYLELPHNLLYSPGPENYRRLSCGSKQVEWHLERSAWEQILLECGYEIVASYTGDKGPWEFIWVLR